MKKHFLRVIGAAGLSLALYMGSLVGYAADFTVVNDVQVFAVADAEPESEKMLPLRYTAENCGFSVTWNEDKSILLNKNDLQIQLKIDSDSICVNGETVNLNYTPRLIGNKTYLPTGFYTSFFTDKYITETGENTYALTNKSPVSAENMMKTVQEISQIPRHPTDKTHKDAIEYITSKFEECGYIVEQQPFEYGSRRDEPLNGVNLIAVKKADLEPTGDVLVLGAHYDGVKGMPAANDNGSGLSVLLEIARILKALPSDTEIRFVAFDAEEDGLYGSKAYVKQLTDTQNIIGMLNFDMLAGKKAGKVGVHSADERDCYLIDILRQNYEFCDVVRETNPYGSSDYQSFPPRLIPAVDFSHAVIFKENHNENDLAEYISPDMLEFAAKGGVAITTAIMSNLTPSSYQKIAKPQDNNDVFEITSDTHIPTRGLLEKIQRETGAVPVQIESDDHNPKYKVHIKLFDFAQPLDLTYSGLSSELVNPYIDLTGSGLSYENVKALLDKNIGCSVKIKGDDYSYRYDSIYGNSFNLHFDPKSEEKQIYISIGNYSGDSREAYAIENGELVRMDSVELETKYEITRTKDGVSVTEVVPKPSKELEISSKAQKCWDRIKPLLTPKELDELSYFVLESDGFFQTIFASESSTAHVNTSFLGLEDVKISEKYKDLPQNVQEHIKFVLTQDEGYTISTNEILPGRQLLVDHNDLLDERGAAYSDTDIVKAYAAMKGLDLFSPLNFHDAEKEYPENGTPFEKNIYSYKQGTVMYTFAEHFYQKVFSEEKWYLYDLFSKYSGEFVCEEAAGGIANDMAYSFAEFVVRDKPVGESVVEQKVTFFYNYPEYVAVREQIRQHM